MTSHSIARGEDERKVAASTALSSSSSSAPSESASLSTTYAGRKVITLLSDGRKWNEEAISCIYRLLFAKESEVIAAEKAEKLKTFLAVHCYSPSRPIPTTLLDTVISFVSSFKCEPDVESSLSHDPASELNEFLTQCESVVRSFDIGDDGQLTPLKDVGSKDLVVTPKDLNYSKLMGTIKRVQKLLYTSRATLKEGLYFTANETVNCFAIWQFDDLHIFTNLEMISKEKNAIIDRGYHLGSHDWYMIKRCEKRKSLRSQSVMWMKEEIDTLQRLPGEFTKRKCRYPSWLQPAPLFLFLRASIERLNWIGYVTPYEGNLFQWLNSEDVTPVQRIGVCSKVLFIYQQAQKQEFIVRGVKPDSLVYRRNKGEISEVAFNNIVGSDFASEMLGTFKDFPETTEFSSPEDIAGMYNAAKEQNGERFVSYAWNHFHFSVVASCFTILTRECPYSTSPRLLNVTLLAPYGPLIRDTFEKMLTPSKRINTSVKQLMLALGQYAPPIPVSTASSSSSSSKGRMPPIAGAKPIASTEKPPPAPAPTSLRLPPAKK